MKQMPCGCWVPADPPPKPKHKRWIRLRRIRLRPLEDEAKNPEKVEKEEPKPEEVADVEEPDMEDREVRVIDTLPTWQRRLAYIIAAVILLAAIGGAIALVAWLALNHLKVLFCLGGGIFLAWVISEALDV